MKTWTFGHPLCGRCAADALNQKPESSASEVELGLLSPVLSAMREAKRDANNLPFVVIPSDPKNVCRERVGGHVPDATRYIDKCYTAPQTIVRTDTERVLHESGPSTALLATFEPRRLLSMLRRYYDGTDRGELKALLCEAWGSPLQVSAGHKPAWLDPEGAVKRKPSAILAEPHCFCPATSEYDPPCPRHGILGIGVTGR